MFTPPPSPLPRPQEEPTQLQEEDFELDSDYSDSVPSTPTSPAPFLLPNPPPLRNPTTKHRSSHSTSLHLKSLQKRKRLLGQRTKWVAILVPLALVLLALSSRWFRVRRQAVSGWSVGVLKREIEPVIGRDFVQLNNVPLSVSTDPHTLPLPTSDTQSLTRSQSQPSASAANTNASTNTQTLAGTAQPVPTVPAPSASSTDGSGGVPLPTPFPQPWDSDIGQNFSTQACFTFFQNMTNSESFRSCRPFSLLVGTSSEVVDAQGNLTLLNNIVWGTCNTKLSFQQCVSNMAGFALDLEKSCSQEIGESNVMALTAMWGLQSFPVMYQAGCLTDPTTNSYCYLEAVHNTNPSDLFLYQIPMGLRLPSATTPTCSSCSKNLLAIYASALHQGTGASVLGQSQNGASTGDSGAQQWIEVLAKDYGSAVGIGERTCGNGFLDESVGSGAMTIKIRANMRMGMSGILVVATTLIAFLLS